MGGAETRCVELEPSVSGMIVSHPSVYWLHSGTDLLANPTHKCRWCFCFCHDVPGIDHTPAPKQKERCEVAILIDDLFSNEYQYVCLHLPVGTTTTPHTILFPNTFWLYQGTSIGRIAESLNAALGPLWQSLTAMDPGIDRVRYSSHQ